MSNEAKKRHQSIFSGLPKAWRLAISAFLATRLVLVVFAWIVHHHLGFTRRLADGHFLYHGGEPHTNWLVDAFQKWDAYWFLNIVREGYRFFGPIEQIHGVTAGQPETNVTPFPLYPLLMKLGGFLVGDPALAGFIISQACLLVCMVWLYKLVATDESDRRAVLAVWMLAAYPFTYAFSAIYSESLFFMFTVGAVLAARRGRYLLASVAGMMSALTRLMGAFVVIPLFLELWRQRSLQQGGGLRKAWLLLLIPCGTLGYFAYLWWLTGEPMAYFIGQEGWHKELVGPWFHPWRWLTIHSMEAEDYLDLFTTLGIVATLVMGYRRIRWSYWIYALVCSLVLLSSSYLLGLPRYMGGIFPFYLIWAGLSERHPLLGQALVVMFAMGSIIAFWVWTTWCYAF